MDMNTSILPIEQEIQDILLVNYLIHHKVKLNCKKLSDEEVERFFNGSNYDISHIKFIDRNGKERRILYN
jgi:hypothetical protein